MVRAKLILFAAGFLAVVGIARSQNAVWQGDNSQSFSDGGNWMGGSPANDGSETLVINSGENPVMNIDNGIGADFSGVQVEQGGDLTIIGANGITVGSAGLDVTHAGSSSTSNLTIDVPVTLTVNQHWYVGYPGGNLTVSGAIGGAYDLVVDGSGGGASANVTLDSGDSSFGSLTFLGTSAILTIGAGSTGSGDDVSSGPLGTGIVTLGDGTELNSVLGGSSIEIDNTFFIGDISTGLPVIIGGQKNNDNPLSTVLTLGGTVYLNDATTEIDLGPNSLISFNGLVDGLSGHTLNIGNVGVGNSLAIFRGDLSNIPAINLLDSATVIFDGDPSTQLTGVTSISTVGSSNYVGVGSGGDDDGYNLSGQVAGFITKLGGPSFQGTLGFDTTTGSNGSFSDPIDLSGLTSSGFVGIGSATSAVLSSSAVVTPPGMTPAAQNNYPFGGGGGILTVDSPLDDDVVNSISRALTLSAGNSPLTLILSDELGYSGGTNVDGGILIFDAPPPSLGQIHLGYGSTHTGYIGTTSNAGYADTDIGNFLSLVDVNATAAGGLVIGFDATEGSRTVDSTTIDVSGLPSNLYLGTSTSVFFGTEVSFIPNGTQYQFAGVKGGFVTVNSSLSDNGMPYSVAVGLPDPLESFSIKNGFVSISSVQLSGDNSYTGGTILNSGYLYVSNSNSLGGGGSGALTVPDPNPAYNRSGWIASLNSTSGGDVELPNAIVLGTNGIALNFGSPTQLTLSGNISDASGDHAQLGIFGKVELAGNNTYSGYTTLGAGGDLLVTTANSLGTNTLSVFPSSSAPAILESASGTVTVPNQILLNNGAVLELNTPGSSNALSFTGEILDAESGGSLIISGYTSFNQADVYSGGTTLEQAYASINDPESLGTGPITITGDGGSTISAYSTFALPNAIVVNQPLSLIGTGYEFTLSGSISGYQDITINSPIELSGDNSAYSGTILFNGGSLTLSNANALGSASVILSASGALGISSGITITNPIALEDGGRLGGYGTLAPSTPNLFMIENASTITGGSGSSVFFNNGVTLPVPGTLTLSGNANLEFGGGGVLQFAVASQFGTPGTDFSAINSAGLLNQTANSSDPFVIQLVAVNPTTKQLGIPTFNTTLASTWTLISAISITNFDPTGFAVDSSTYGNGAFAPGTFNVTESGNDLLLNFTPVPEPTTWALMASGVFALGAAVRRRRRR